MVGVCGLCVCVFGVCEFEGSLCVVVCFVCVCGECGLCVCLCVCGVCLWGGLRVCVVLVCVM